MVDAEGGQHLVGGIEEMHGSGMGSAVRFQSDNRLHVGARQLKKPLRGEGFENFGLVRLALRFTLIFFAIAGAGRLRRIKFRVRGLARAPFNHVCVTRYR